MKWISEILTTDHIILDLNVQDKFEAISKLIKTLDDCSEVIDQEKFANDIVQREKDFPTGLENGTALPHARTTAVTDLIMAFGRCQTGVDFGAPDSKPAHLVFLFGVPRDEVKDYLKTIAQLSRMLQDIKFKDRLNHAKQPEDIIKAICDTEKRQNRQIG
jgi:fructose-specific phosphotransferase system IIA component